MILVIDDEESNRLALERIFAREGWPVRVAVDGRQGLEILREGEIGVVVSDLKMPGMGGLELLRATRQVAPQVQVILVTAYGTVESAVEAMKEGAYDFVTKPLRRTEVIASVRKALEKHDLLRENLRLRQEIAQASPGELIGQSGELRALMEEARQVAPSMASVLLTGESGTGKGLLARWIHTVSARPGRLVTVNCGALPENLLESELFGYEAGAFTGAHGRKEGRFDLASGGTIFLDEVTEMPLPLQVKLLRVLQDGEYERLGGTKTIRTEVRVVAATNRDPEQAVAEGRLRSDLYYRLNVIRLHVPALRERRADIALLARHFASTHGARNGRVLRGLEPEALAALERHAWPGNVRELENAMERAAVLSREDVVRLGDLPPAIRAAASNINEVPRLIFTPGTPLRDVERRMIEATLRQCNGDRSLAANLLGITARTIYRREAEWRDPEG
ncbi:MAG: sigma-54 dependent transcriptional regulator [Myxococcota bacterium]|jgi:two-component system response regulator HydG